MSDSIRQLLEEYHGYYEVRPYYVVIKLKPGSGAPSWVQAGFDVDVYGVSNKSELELPPPEYGIAYADLKKVADTIRRAGPSFCSYHFSASTGADLNSAVSQRQWLALFCRHIRPKDYKEIYEKTICADPFKPFRNPRGRSDHGHSCRFHSPEWTARPGQFGRAVRAEYRRRIGNKHCEKFALF
jgi:hypothetical protein